MPMIRIATLVVLTDAVTNAKLVSSLAASVLVLKPSFTLALWILLSVVPVPSHLYLSLACLNCRIILRAISLDIAVTPWRIKLNQGKHNIPPPVNRSQTPTQPQ